MAVEMRPLALLVLLLTAGVVRGNDPLLGPERHAAPPPDPVLDRTVTLIECPPPTPRDDWRVALDLGLPTGVRVQRRVFDSNLWAEGGVGAWLIVPFVSGCLRYDCTLLRRERNLFAVRPGVSATLVVWAPNFGAGIDSEFIWQHTFHKRHTTELGVRLGMTAVVGHGGRRREDWSGVFPAPVATLLFSWQF
jgi:hypothetical protein